MNRPEEIQKGNIFEINDKTAPIWVFDTLTEAKKTLSSVNTVRISFLNKKTIALCISVYSEYFLYQCLINDEILWLYFIQPTEYSINIL